MYFHAFALLFPIGTVDHHVGMERDYKDLKFKYAKVAKERKDLYNKVIELKG